MAKNVVASNAGIGQANVTTRVKLTIQAARKCFYFGALPVLIIPAAIWIAWAPPHAIDMVKLDAIARFADQGAASKWRITSPDGTRGIVSIRTNEGKLAQYLTPLQIRAVLAPSYGPVRQFYTLLTVSGLLSFGGFGLLWWIFNRRGEQQQTNQRLRGAHDTVEGEKLSKLVLKRSQPSYKLVDVWLPADTPMRGILAVGAQGSGKSIAIKDLMEQVFAKGRKSIIYDQSGEFYRTFFRPGKDFFFNPACLGSVPWSIFEELTHTYDADTLAQAFLPPKATGAAAGANSFFEDAARALFSVILLRLAERGATNTQDIAHAFLAMPADEMGLLIRNSVASSSIGGDSKGQRQGVISSISIYLNGIASVDRGNWSISDFLDAPEDSRFFLVGTDDTKAMFAPLYRLILSVAFSAIAARQEVVHEDRYWFWLDEIHTLGDIKIDENLATMRKYGVCVVGGTQNDSQFVSLLGEARAATAMNGFNTLLQLRLNEPEAQKRAAERLSKQETAVISQNQAVAVVEQRDGAGLVINEQEKWLVMPGDIGHLDPCVGYLKLAGDYPVGVVDYRHWLPKRKGKRSRIDRYAETQPSPERDPRFAVQRVALPTGESAFDSVRREAEEAKKEDDARKAAEAKGSDSADQTAGESTDGKSAKQGPSSDAAPADPAKADKPDHDSPSKTDPVKQTIDLQMTVSPDAQQDRLF